MGLDIFTMQGDCLECMKELPDNSVDAVVTDPPYGLSKEPDMAEVLRHWMAGDDYKHKGAGFMGKSWDSFVPGPAIWKECLRVLKPGGHMLAFFGTRTYDMGTLAIRLAGFEIRDQIGWVYGSGFPKSHDVSKGIDKMLGAQGSKGAVTGKSGSARNSMAGDFAGGDYHEYLPGSDEAARWQGWGTALKPAWEPICVARKPLIGTVAKNVMEHGTGALNIDGCRVPTEDSLGGGMVSKGRPKVSEGWDRPWMHDPEVTERKKQESAAKVAAAESLGRWPANLIHDGSDEVLACFPQAPGQLADVSHTAPSPKTSTVYGRMNRGGEASAQSDNEGAVGFKMKPGARRLDQGSAARFFYSPKASRKDRDEGLEAFEAKKSAASEFRPNHAEKAAQGEDGNPYGRWKPVRNNHPTVKPTDLMAYLCRLVTPPGGTVLDPFMGSGTTGKACAQEKFSFIGIEQDPDHFRLAEARIDAAYGIKD